MSKGRCRIGQPDLTDFAQYRVAGSSGRSPSTTAKKQWIEPIESKPTSFWNGLEMQSDKVELPAPGTATLRNCSICTIVIRRASFMLITIPERINPNAKSPAISLVQAHTTLDKAGSGKTAISIFLLELPCRGCRKALNDNPREYSRFSSLRYHRDMATTSHPSFIIVGLTIAGKRFRPSDWAERLCGVLSAFGAEKKMRYSPYVGPRTYKGEKAVFVDGRLYEVEPMAYRFVLHFAQDNDLQLIQDLV